VTETTALGAAYLAGLAVGYWKNLDAIAKQWKVEKVFEPKMPRSQVTALRSRWNDALGRATRWELPAPGETKRGKRAKK